MSPSKIKLFNHIFLKHKKIIIIIDLVKEIIKYSFDSFDLVYHTGLTINSIEHKQNGDRIIIFVAV